MSEIPTDQELDYIIGRVESYRRHQPPQTGQIQEHPMAAMKRFAQSSEHDIPKLVASIRELKDRDGYWQNLYMLQQRYTASYRTGKAPSEQIMQGLSKFRELLGLVGVINK